MNAFQLIDDYLNTLFIERESIIRVLMLSFLTAENTLLLGPPGTAKSDLIAAFSRCLDKRYFTWLMSKTTTPEELFGE